MRRKRNESTVLHAIRVAPWRRGAPKAQDRCASKRHPSTQRSVCQLCKALLRIVISSEARNLWHSRRSGRCVKTPNGKPVIKKPSGITTIHMERRFHIFMRRTSTPHSRAEHSFEIKGRYVPWADTEPRNLFPFENDPRKTPLT